MDRSSHGLGTRLLVPAVVGALVALTACEVKNPGRILDEDLDEELLMKPLVVGMSADFSRALDDLAFLLARTGDEMTGSGSYFSTGLFRRGILNREDMDGFWEQMHSARWVAENGLLRMQEVLGEKFTGHPLTARAYLLAGLANRVLGECMCFAVFDSASAAALGIEGGITHANAKHFDRAIQHFTEAINHGGLAGTKDIVTAAYGGRAQAKVGLGDWTGALADAAKVPTDFTYEAIFSDNSSREWNVIWLETHGRAEMSAFGTLAGTFDPPDPRAPYTNCFVTPRPANCRSHQGADGETPHYQQEKIPERGSDIPVVKGTEMRLIEAEAALRNEDLATAIAKINEVRNFYELADTSAADLDADGDVDANDVWILFDDERHLTLWLEGRRFLDLRRWDAEGRRFMAGVGFLYGDNNRGIYEKSPSIEKRATCIPISLSECQTNPNLAGAPECAGTGGG